MTASVPTKDMLSFLVESLATLGCELLSCLQTLNFKFTFKNVID